MHVQCSVCFLCFRSVSPKSGEFHVYSCPLDRSKCISENMAKKIANSGLCTHHLRLAFERGGPDEIKILFSEKTNWKALKGDKQIQHNLICISGHRRPL